MIKAIIFDCFGVLTTESYDLFKDKYLTEPGARAKADAAMDQLNVGNLSYQDFAETLAGLSGLENAYVASYLEKNQPNEALLAYIREQLKPNYKIGMLSNAGYDWISDMFKADDVKMFDSVVLSYRVGMIKPQPEIYELTASELGVKPSECVFIDDREKYCVGARAVGMKAFRYDNVAQTKEELQKLLAAGANN